MNCFTYALFSFKSTLRLLNILCIPYSYNYTVGNRSRGCVIKHESIFITCLNLFRTVIFYQNVKPGYYLAETRLTIATREKYLKRQKHIIYRSRQTLVTNDCFVLLNNLNRKNIMYISRQTVVTYDHFVLPNPKQTKTVTYISRQISVTNDRFALLNNLKNMNISYIGRQLMVTYDHFVLSHLKRVKTNTYIRRQILATNDRFVLPNNSKRKSNIRHISRQTLVVYDHLVLLFHTKQTKKALYINRQIRIDYIPSKNHHTSHHTFHDTRMNRKSELPAPRHATYCRYLANALVNKQKQMVAAESAPTLHNVVP
jgi:hypothetical protein